MKIALGSNYPISKIASYAGNLIVLMRPSHWIKNLFLFLPVFFSGDLFHLELLARIFPGVLAFSLVASGAYILNDYVDMEKDKLHPIKCKRPLTSGKISVVAAFILMILNFALGLGIAWYLSMKFFLVLLIYFVVNVSYSIGLKNISILDVFILSAGFVFRIKGGGVLASVGISQWLMIMVFLLALFMALAKRRDDILIKQSSGKEMRHSLSGYNVSFLNVSLSVVASVIIVSYLMYTLSPTVIIRLDTYRIYYTCIFVAAGLMRYMQLIYIKNETGSPTRIMYKDRFIQICIALWSLSFYFLIYLKDFQFSN